MRKIAIFAEGQSELIFIRSLLPVIFSWENVSFNCFNLYAQQMVQTNYEYHGGNAEILFLIINVGNDETVLGAIKDRENDLINKGYEKIIALRDMYSENYLKRANDEVVEAVIIDFLNGWKKTIQKMVHTDRIKMHCSIMELEAWFLGMYNIFKKKNPMLTVEYIENKLSFNLKKCDPQKFLHPTKQLDNIFNLFRERYDKSYGSIESLCSDITSEDIQNAFENGRCESFLQFYDEIMN